MTVPYTFSNATGTIPLNELDANFANVSQRVNTANTVILSDQPNITSVGILSNLSVSGNVVSGGNIVGAFITGNGSQLSAINAANIVGNIPVANSALTAGTVTSSAQPNITSVGTVVSLNSTGDITGGNLRTTGLVSATGTITTGSNLVVGGVINTTGNIVGAGSLNLGGTLNSTGNITGANIIGSNLITTGSVTVTAQVSATGNIITNGYFVGNGSALTGIIATDIGTLSMLSVTGNIDTGNLISSALVQGATVSATGNIDTGNLISSALVQGATVSATGNIDTGNLISSALVQGATVSATGNIDTGNLNALGSLNAVGNVNATNLYIDIPTGSRGFITGNLEIGGYSNAIGNVRGGNIRTAGLVTATGNVTGGNILTGGLISATGNLTGATILTPTIVTNNIYSDDSTFVTIQDGLNINGDLDINGVINATEIRTIATTVDNLTANAVAGTRAFVTDADSITFGAPAVGGAGNSMPVFSTGSGWYIG